MTTTWMDLAKTRFSQKRHEQTDETDERGVLSVLAVCSPEKIENLKSEEIDWRTLAARYYLHHFDCPVCIAAGRGYGTRCPVGKPLWHVFQSGVRADKQQIQSA